MKRKNIAVFIDGTGQNRSSLPPERWSNVVLLHDAVVVSEEGEVAQSRKYIVGVGTRSGEEITGGGFGIDLDMRVEEGYEFLYQEVNNALEDGYDPHVYLFGFSRGAFAVRWLASLLDFAGVRKDALSTRQIMAAHRKDDREAVRKWQERDMLIKDVPIDFLGVWDTVEASIDPSFGIEDVPQIVMKAFHALALDEWRYTFNPTRFNSSPKVTEVWFPGCHTDVGGGYYERAIANESLKWMVGGAQSAGLLLDTNNLRKAIDDRSKELKYHDELYDGLSSKLWKALNLKAGYAGQFFRTVGASDLLHSCVGRFASAAPENRLTIPDTCIVWKSPSSSYDTALA